MDSLNGTGDSCDPNATNSQDPDTKQTKHKPRNSWGMKGIFSVGEKNQEQTISAVRNNQTIAIISS